MKIYIIYTIYGENADGFYYHEDDIINIDKIFYTRENAEQYINKCIDGEYRSINEHKVLSKIPKIPKPKKPAKQKPVDMKKILAEQEKILAEQEKILIKQNINNPFFII